MVAHRDPAQHWRIPCAARRPQCAFRTTTQLAFTVVLAVPAAASAAPIYDHGFGVRDAQPAASG
jgi:hypothetical protein